MPKTPDTNILIKSVSPNLKDKKSKNKLLQVHTLGLLDKKVRSKFITNQLLYPLLDLKSPLNKSYWNTWHCSNILLQDGKKLTTKYCDHRWCVVCNRIRTAEAINSYSAEVNTIENRCFVTLSRKNVSEKHLKIEIDKLLSDLSKCIRRAKNSLKIKIKAIRKLEVTYNPISYEYHPHFHIITSKQSAEAILKYWMLLNGNNSHLNGQDIREANEGDTIELFKYATKLFKLEKHNKTPEGKQIIEIDVKPLDTIFRALKHRRTFQTYGMTKQVTEEIENILSQEYDCLDSQVEIWHWDNGINNYVTALGETLTNADHSKIYSVMAK